MCSGKMRHSVTIVRRGSDVPSPGSAEPRHTYTTVLTTRAAIETKSGVSQFNQVEVNGKKVSHVFTIRFTAVEFDIRDRVKDIKGNLYSILSTDNEGEWDDFIKIYCARVGNETRVAAQ